MVSFSRFRHFRQVLFKLVQRLASLRSGSNSTDSTSNKPKIFSKGNKKKKKKNPSKCSGEDCTDTETGAIQSQNLAGESKRHPSVGCEVPVVDKKARPTEDGPLDPNWYDSCSAELGCNDDQCWSNGAATVPDSGNYHAEIASEQRKFSGNVEDEVCRDFDAAIALVEGYGNAAACCSSGGGEANLVNIGRIDCISKGASVLASDSDLFVLQNGAELRHGPVDDGIVLALHHHDANNNVNCSSSSFFGQQQTEAIMGANVSRHHEKGLTGRRAQSTGKFRFRRISSFDRIFTGGDCRG